MGSRVFLSKPCDLNVLTQRATLKVECTRSGKTFSDSQKKRHSSLKWDQKKHTLGLSERLIALQSNVIQSYVYFFLSPGVWNGAYLIIYDLMLSFVLFFTFRFINSVSVVRQDTCCWSFQAHSSIHSFAEDFMPGPNPYAFNPFSFVPVIETYCGHWVLLASSSRNQQEHLLLLLKCTLDRVNQCMSE